MKIKIFTHKFKQELYIFFWFGIVFLFFCAFVFFVKLINMIEVKFVLFCFFCFIQRLFLLKMLYACEVIKLERIKGDACKGKYILYYNYFFSETFNKWCLEITDNGKAYKSVINRVLVGESFLENLNEMQRVFSLLDLKGYRVIIKATKSHIIKELVLDDYNKLIEVYRELLLSQKLWNAFFDIYDDNEGLVKSIKFSKRNKVIIHMTLSERDKLLVNISKWMKYDDYLT